MITFNDGCDTRKFKEIVKSEFNMTGLVPWVGIHQNYKGNDVLWEEIHFRCIEEV